MINPDLLFFCSTCKEKFPEELAKINCTIEHTVKHYKKGEYIAYQNDKISFLYMLVKGGVQTEIVSDSGFTLPIEKIKAPYPLAAAFLFADNNKFPVDVIATEECELILITKESVEKQIAKYPGFLRGFMAFNANRMQFLSDRMKIFAHKNIKSKVAFYILSIENQGEFHFDRTITSLADYFGIERPSLSRAISEMVSDGIITYNSGKGKINDIRAFRELF